MNIGLGILLDLFVFICGGILTFLFVFRREIYLFIKEKFKNKIVFFLSYILFFILPIFLCFVSIPINILIYYSKL
jgi:hypothetical protein